MARISAARNVTSSVTWQRNYDPNNAAALNVVPFAEPVDVTDRDLHCPCPLE